MDKRISNKTITENLKGILNIVIFITTFILLLMYLRWGGIKAITGLLIGMIATSYVVLSNNPLVTLMLDQHPKSKNYIQEIKGAKK